MKGETIKAGSIYQSQSERLHSSPSTTSSFQLCRSKTEIRESPRRTPAPSAHQGAISRGEDRSGGGWEECVNVRQSAKTVSDWASGFLCFRMLVHKLKSFIFAYVHAHAGSWVLAAQGFDAKRHSLSPRQLMKLQWDLGGPQWAGPQDASAWIHIKRTVSLPAHTTSSVFVLVQTHSRGKKRSSAPERQDI